MNFAAQTHVDNSFGNSLGADSTDPPCNPVPCANQAKPRLRPQPSPPRTCTGRTSSWKRPASRAPCGASCTSPPTRHGPQHWERRSHQPRRRVPRSWDLPPSRQVYGEQSHVLEVASSEQSTLEPTNPYAASKAAAEMMCKAYQARRGDPPARRCIIIFIVAPSDGRQPGASVLLQPAGHRHSRQQRVWAASGEAACMCRAPPLPPKGALPHPPPPRSAAVPREADPEIHAAGAARQTAPHPRRRQRAALVPARVRRRRRV